MSGRAQVIDRVVLRELCRDCGASIYLNLPPNGVAAENAARLLFMTAAHESHLEWNRQLGFGFSSGNGAHGLFQTEWGSITDSLKLLDRKPVLEKRCAEWLFQHRNADLMVKSTWYAGPIKKALLYAIIGWPRCGVLFARLHYLRAPGAIPGALEGMAAYAKEHYNTPKGKASEGDYLTAFKRYWPGDA